METSVWAPAAQANIVLELQTCLWVLLPLDEGHYQAVLDGKHRVVTQIGRVPVENLRGNGLVTIGKDLIRREVMSNSVFFSTHDGYMNSCSRGDGYGELSIPSSGCGLVAIRDDRAGSGVFQPDHRWESVKGTKKKKDKFLGQRMCHFESSEPENERDVPDRVSGVGSIANTRHGCP